MKTPLISVLMPVYNAERFLNEAIDSILIQTLYDFEFVIIDDGSSDKSVDIILSYSDPRIKFYQNKINLGISATLNRGIELCQARYIARMDADDISHPNRLERQYEFIKLHSDGVLFSCWAVEVSEDRKPITIGRLKPEHYYYNLTFCCWIYHPTMIYRKDAIQSIGKYTVPYSEDFELIWQILRRYKIYHLPEVLLEYRISTQSLWQFSKKNETKTAKLKQVRRNVLFYMASSSIQIDDWLLELLSHSYDSQKQFSIKQILSAIHFLDFLTRKIIQIDNVNMIPSHVINASKEKKNHMLTIFYSKLGYLKGSILLMRSGSWQLLVNLIINRLFFRLNQLIKAMKLR
jgi:glycosyltransferase involved in cell wall biosynthesis